MCIVSTVSLHTSPPPPCVHPRCTRHFHLKRYLNSDKYTLPPLLIYLFKTQHVVQSFSSCHRMRIWGKTTIFKQISSYYKKLRVLDSILETCDLSIIKSLDRKLQYHRQNLADGQWRHTDRQVIVPAKSKYALLIKKQVQSAITQGAHMGTFENCDQGNLENVSSY